MRVRFPLPVAACAVVAIGNAALPTQQEALRLAYPGAQFQRREHFLTDAQAKRVRELAKVEIPGLWWVAYEATRDGKPVGVAFFDTHRVRTLNETAMVALGPDGAILRVETIQFHEPQEYLAREAWRQQFAGQRLGDELSLKRAIRPLSGATLTANALVDASRRGLALFQVLYGEAK